MASGVCFVRGVPSRPPSVSYSIQQYPRFWKDHRLTLATRVLYTVGWDAVAKTTWSKRIGFLDLGTDIDGTLYASEQAARYLVTVGMYPWLDNLFDKNPVYRIGPPTYTNVANHAVKILTDRLTGEDGHDAQGDTDFLDLYIEAKGQHPEVVDIPMIVSCKWSFSPDD